MSLPLPARLLCRLLLLLGLAVSLRADKHVAVTSTADTDYTRRKFGDHGAPCRETYVFMQGRCFEGATVDPSFARLSFRDIAGYLAPELARRNYLPTKDAQSADLLLLVHWGVTIPHVTSQEMRAETTTEFVSPENAAAGGMTAADPTNTGDFTKDLMNSVGGTDEDRAMEFSGLNQMNDQLSGEMTSSSNLGLLGYTRHLHGPGKRLLPSEEEATLRSDLTTERYFIIVKAYDLQSARAGERRRAVWTLYMNIRSPGNNFQTALTRMSAAAVDYFGRTTDKVETVRPQVREGKVDIGDLIILGEAR